ncbi:VanZ family protein [Gammaproteobacteria bacterium]|nr:VanZ family protein [Gammaproteobacteria bacterium]
MISLLQRIRSLSLNLKIILSVILIAVVTFLHIMMMPSLGIEPSLSIDKIAHMMIFYFVGLWFFIIAKNIRIIFLFVLLCGYALSMEFMQINIPYRSFEWLDWVADVFGIWLSVFHLSKKL